MKFAELKNKYLDKDCVVLTCGPSLTEYSKDKIRDFCKGKVVICVKEAIIEYYDICTIFIVNNTRYRRYNINFDNILTIYVGDNNSIKKNHKLSISEDRPFFPDKQLLLIKNFAEYDFDNKFKRPWGPGIMYECVFYLCKYIGIQTIYTIGWDLINTEKETNITHYFEDYKSENYKNSERRKNHNYKNEMLLVNNNITHMYKYFKDNGMNIFVVGEQSFVNRGIPRIQL